MKNSIEEKRKEIFELHQSWLRPDIPLMRQPAPVQKSPDLKDESTKITAKPTFTTNWNKNWVAIFVLVLAIILVISELIFFAFELKLFR